MAYDSMTLLDFLEGERKELTIHNGPDISLHLLAC